MRADVVLLRIEAALRTVGRQLRAAHVLELERIAGDRIEHRDVRARAAGTRLVQYDSRPNAPFGQEIDDGELVRRGIEQVVLGVVVVRIERLALTGSGRDGRDDSNEQQREEA